MRHLPLTVNDPWLAPPFAAAPAVLPALRAGEVHVWLAHLDELGARVDEVAGLLSPEEQARVAQLRFAGHRQDYVACRGWLRTVLGGYVHTPGRSVPLTLGPHGKPFLPGCIVEFNLSHSGRLALLAVAQGRRVGVDLERHREDYGGEAIARRYFSPREVAALLSLPPPRRGAAFFDCWTRKEAFLKATGEGLTCSLDSFDVALDPAEPARLLAVRGGRYRVEDWRLCALAPGEGYSGALVCECPRGEAASLQVYCWRWPVNRIVGAK